MRDIKRIDSVLDRLKDLWKMYPDQRLGQLLFNCTRFGTRTIHSGTIKDIFHYEDDKILQDLNESVYLACKKRCEKPK